MRITTTLTKAVAAAALTVGLVAGGPAAQAAPTTAPVTTASHAHAGAASVAKKASKAKTRLSASAPRTVQAGDVLKISAKLTRRSGSTYKPYAKKKLVLVLLDGPGADTGTVIVTRKTSAKGKVTFLLDTTDADLAGKTFDFLVAYEGGSKAKAAESKVLRVSITK